MGTNWKEIDEKTLLARAFMIGLTGVVLCIVPIMNHYLHFLNAPMGPINGAGIGLQLFAMSILIMALTKKKLSEITKDKVKKMIIVLTVSLLYFFLTL
jgi:hypothetical protein